MKKIFIQLATKKLLLCATLLALSVTLVHVSFAELLTQTALIGVWDCKTAAMNNHGKPGAGIEFKPRSMVYTFRNDGKWAMEAGDSTHTKKSGAYQLHGSELILKNQDGSNYQDWKTDLSTDGTSLLVIDKKLVLTFVRVTSSS